MELIVAASGAISCMYMYGFFPMTLAACYNKIVAS